MVSWTPAALVFYTKHCQGVCCGKPISIEAATDQQTNNLDVASSTAAEDKSSCVQSLKRGLERIARLPRDFFEKWLPTAVIKPRFVWTIGFGSLIVVSFMVVFYYPSLKLPDKEQFQVRIAMARPINYSPEYLLWQKKSSTIIVTVQQSKKYWKLSGKSW